MQEIAGVFYGKSGILGKSKDEPAVQAMRHTNLKNKKFTIHTIL